MSSPIVVEVPRDVIFPPAEATTDEWQGALSAANRAIDVERFIPAAASRADAWQAAIDSAQAAGGTKVVTRTADHLLDKGIDTKGVPIEGPGSGQCQIRFTADAAPVNGAMVWASGSLSALPALGANVALYATTLTFASPPSVAPGDWLVIYNSADGSWNPARPVYRAGEYVQVKAVSGSTVTLTHPTYDTYTAGGTISVHKLNPVRPKISGISFQFRQGAAGIKIVAGSEVAFDDLRMTGTNQSHIFLQQCVNVALSGVHAWDASPSISNNYGVMLANCQNVDIDGCFLETTRHGLTTGGGDYVGCVPSRNITVRGGRIGGMSDTVAGCDMHGNAEYVHFSNVDLPNGIHLAGDHAAVEGGRVRTNAQGVGVHISETIGWDFTINTTVDLTTSPAAGLAPIYILGDANVTRGNRGALQVRGTINMGSFSAVSGTTVGCYIYDVAGKGAAGVDIEIDLTVTSERPDLQAPSAYAVYVRAAAGGGFRTVDMAVRTRRMGTRVECNPQRFIPHDCRIIEAPDYGLFYTTIDNPIFTQPAVWSRNNIITRPGLAGMYYIGPGMSAGRIRSDNDEATDCNRSGTGDSTTGASIVFRNWRTVIYRAAVVGDTLSPANQTRRDVVIDVGTLVEYDVLDIGSVSATTRTNITTTRSRVAP